MRSVWRGAASQIVESEQDKTTPRKTQRCSGCGNTSALSSYFRATRRGPLCPRCQARYWPAQHAWLLIALGVILFFLLPVMAWNAQVEVEALVEGWTAPPLLRWSPFLVLNPLLVLALASLLVIPHELSHAAAALLAGGRILEIRIFEGAVRWQRQLRGTTLVLGSLPLTGLCIVAFRDRNRVRERVLLLLAAGPVFNVAVILALLPFYDGSRLVSAWPWPELLVIANALLLITALLPYRASSGGSQRFSDGLQLLNILSGRYSESDLHLSFLATEAAHLLRVGDYQRAAKTSEAGLALYAGHTILENTRAVALLEAGHHAQALAAFDELLARVQRPDLSDLGGEPGVQRPDREYMEALLLNNVAYASLFSVAEPGAAQRAKDCAQRAFLMAPWLREVRGTWGATLIETGDIEQGLTHVTEAAREADTPRAKAAYLAHAAIGHHRLGRDAEATALLGEARLLDPTGIMVKKADVELALAQ